jgi:hypothetical protein
LILKFSLEHGTFEDDQCKGNCIVNAAAKWLIYKPVDITLLILPKHNGAEGHTRTTMTTDGIPKAVSAIGVGGAMAFQAMHITRHELGHAMGFEGHTHQSFVFNRGRKLFPACTELEVKSYPETGLKPGCENRTYLGSHMVPGQYCGNRAPGAWNEFDVKFTAPYYGEKFRYIFGCYASKFGPQAPQPPKPTPTPTPTPIPPQNSNCAVWQNLINLHCKK